LLTPEAPREEELRKRIEALGLSVKTIRLSHDAEKRQRTIVYELKLRKAQLFQMSNKAVSEMMNCTGVVRVEWDCPQCGKHREGNIFEFAFQYCDHEGDW